MCSLSFSVERAWESVRLERYAELCRMASCPKTQTNSRLARRAVSIVIDSWRALDLGRVGGDVGDSGSPSCAKLSPFDDKSTA